MDEYRLFGGLLLAAEKAEAETEPVASGGGVEANLKPQQAAIGESRDSSSEVHWA